MRVDDWEARGERRELLGRGIFVIDAGPRDDPEPILTLHGFPDSSFTWHTLHAALEPDRRVVSFDMLGFGLSEKPFDQPFSLFEQADIATALAADLGIERCALVTHDMGDSVGAELLARALDGTLPFEVTTRVITDGSIYLDLVQLSDGQKFLLALPDEPLPEDGAPNEELFTTSLAAIFGPSTPASRDHLRAEWTMMERDGGNRLLARLVRYYNERLVHEGRWTGAIEKHPSPLGIAWGAHDPIAVYPMAERLHAARPDSTLVRLETGHYPMIEDPGAFTAAVRAALA
jgi:pimeloyl-ACP methyl ester carboxylesterase